MPRRGLAELRRTVRQRRPSCPHCRREMPRRLPGSGVQPKEPPEVEATKVRAAFEKSGMTKCELAGLMGWVRTVCNIDRVNTTLGYKKQSGNGKYKEKLTYELAVRLAKAIGADYYEIGV